MTVLKSLEPAQGMLHCAGVRCEWEGLGPGGQGSCLWDEGVCRYSCPILSLSLYDVSA